MATRTDRPAKIEGRLRLLLRQPGGPVMEERRGHNAVLRSGAELVAALFQGSLTTPVNGMAVGIDPTPPSPPYERTALTTTTSTGEPALLRAGVGVAPEDMTVEVLPEEFKVRVFVRGVIPPDRAVSPDDTVERVDIGEAALGVLAPAGDGLSQLYNRVVFEPLPKTRDQELVLYWEIDFPYGA